MPIRVCIHPHQQVIKLRICAGNRIITVRIVSSKSYKSVRASGFVAKQLSVIIDNPIRIQVNRQQPIATRDPARCFSHAVYIDIPVN